MKRLHFVQNIYNNMTTQKKNNNILQVILLLLMLVAFPAISWIYMGRGFDRFSKSIQEMRNYGHLPAFQLDGPDGTTLDSSLVNGQMTLVAFVNPATETGKKQIEILQLVHKQFDERNDFKLLIHLPEQTDIARFKNDHRLTDEQQVYAGKSSVSRQHQLIQQIYRLPDFDTARVPGDSLQFKSINQPLSEYPYFVLINEDGIIRNYYPVLQPDEMERMVEQIALTLPRDIEGNPRLRRGKEL